MVDLSSSLRKRLPDDNPPVFSPPIDFSGVYGVDLELTSHFCRSLKPKMGRFFTCPKKIWGFSTSGVSENVVHPIVPNGFADHYPVLKNGYN